MLATRDDPGVRTELIHELPRSGVGITTITRRLLEEKTPSTRRALILCLGEFPVGALPAAERATLTADLLKQYRTDPDPGIHGAIDWLLRQKWGSSDQLAEADHALASPNMPPDRDWFINGQGQAFSIVRGPVEFPMGSTPESDPDRQDDETLHTRRIPRSFAIGAREVTVAEYGQFLDTKPAEVVDVRRDPQFSQYILTPDSAVGNVTWFEAARYCNWLSAREGIAEVQWCYPKDLKPDSKLPVDHLARNGYRLLTEAEWEFACRAGSLATRPYGRSEARLGQYGWYGENAGKTMHPVGRKKPNELGLFDILGNAVEWCGDVHKPYPQTTGKSAALDTFDVAGFDATARRPVRGGTFFFPPTLIRSAYRVGELPTTRATVVGFRVARTLP